MDFLIKCPVCLKTLVPPIRQCLNGHSICGNCSTAIQKCPTCTVEMSSSVRNHQLEQIIEQFQVKKTVECSFAKNGCKFIIKRDELQDHEKQCIYRMFTCEGKKYCGWNCNWKGSFEEILKHFKNKHSVLEFKGVCLKSIDLNNNYKDISAVSFGNGSKIFWMKQKIDTVKQKCFWTVQAVGLEKQASNYFYEFEIFDGNLRKFKISEICESDQKDTDMIFESEKCVVVPFNLMKSYMNSIGKISFRFRIMKIENNQN